MQNGSQRHSWRSDRFGGNGNLIPASTPTPYPYSSRLISEGEGESFANRRWRSTRNIHRQMKNRYPSRSTMTCEM
ncbi:hypothetical protein CEXT_472791 [Caerostris extrusa]|uniref:Uncharacterized protein n=1 Tax=Caerostris extrusa TaxID=172846 RepID=A0AAV4X8F2_CAEEX|nr:hypothetical protein CEXT_472791 [Caerostris extrusa]